MEQKIPIGQETTDIELCSINNIDFTNENKKVIAFLAMPPSKVIMLLIKVE